MIIVYRDGMVEVYPSYKGNPMFNHMPDIEKWLNLVRVYDQIPDDKLHFGMWYNPHNDKGCIAGWCAKDPYFIEKGLHFRGVILVYKKKYWIRKLTGHDAMNAFFKNKGDKEKLYKEYFLRIFCPTTKESSRHHIKKAIAEYVERTTGYILFPPPKDALQYW